MAAEKLSPGMQLISRYQKRLSDAFLLFSDGGIFTSFFMKMPSMPHRFRDFLDFKE